MSLKGNNPTLFAEFCDAKREAEGHSVLVRSTDRFPLCGRGDINTYAVFAELNWHLISPKGRVGCIVPTGIATDDTTKYFFQEIVDSKSLVSLHSFENEALIFPGVHHAMKFSLMTLGGTDVSVDAVDFMFFARQISDIAESSRHFSLTDSQIAKLNPSTRTCPVFRTGCDATIVARIYDNVHVFTTDEEPADGKWDISFGTLFHMSNDSHIFASSDKECDDTQLLVPLYEAKIFHQYDHRFGTYDGQSQAQANQGKLPEFTDFQHADPDLLIRPRYFVPREEVARRLAGKWEAKWIIAWRDICRNVDSRTAIASVLPYSGTGGSNLIFSRSNVQLAPLLVANLNAFCLDYVARQKVLGTHLNFMPMRQLPIISPAQYEESTLWMSRSTVHLWLLRRLLELTYTAWDLEAFAKDCGYDGSPFRWYEDRRFLLRSELDAAYFHLYLGKPEEWDADSAELKEMFPTPRDAVDYIMETFPIIKRKDEQKHGEYRTKQRILKIYDAMQKAIDTGHPYQTLLDPPPGPPTDAAGNFLPMAQWDKTNWPSHIHPPRKPVEIRPVREVAAMATVETAFPSSDRDKWLCATMLDLVEADPGRPAVAYLDAIWLATHPDRCATLLSSSDQSNFHAATKSLSKQIAADVGTSLPWRDLCDTLLGNRSLRDASGDQRTQIEVGDNLHPVRNQFGTLSANFIAGVVKATERLRELQEGALAVDDQTVSLLEEVRQGRDAMTQT